MNAASFLPGPAHSFRNCLCPTRKAVAVSLDANYGPVFAALIAPGIIDAINTGQISLDQFLQSNMALTWIPAIAA